MLRPIIKILKALNSNESPWQISLGLLFGAVLGLTPLLSPHNLIVLFLALIINLNISMMLVSALVFSGVAYFLDPMFHQIGYGLLTSDGLHGFWTSVFSQPAFILANLNNTIVMGSLATVLILSVPLFFLFNVLIKKYREKFNAFLEKFPVLRFLKILNTYNKLS